MSRKSKGIGAERELIHKFWSAGWAACRVAGSGAIKYPCPDIIAGCPLRRIAVECKSTGEEYQYLEEEVITKLSEFCQRFCAEPWIGVRFDRSGWYFLTLEDLQSSGKAYSISLEQAKVRGILFEELVTHRSGSPVAEHNNPTPPRGGVFATHQPERLKE